MKKKLCVLFAALLLCGCNKEPVEITETFTMGDTYTIGTTGRNFHESAEEFTSETAAETEPPESVTVFLGETETDSFIYRLNADGYFISEDKMHGSLKMSLYSKEDGSFLSECEIYADNDFYAVPLDENTFSLEATDDYALLTEFSSEGAERSRLFMTENGTLRHLRILAENKGGEVIFGATEGLNMYSGSSMAIVNTDTSKIVSFTDNAYTEFKIDYENLRIFKLGSMELEPADEEIKAAVLKEKLMSDLSGCDIYGYYTEDGCFIDGHKLECIGEDSEREETYYRIPAEIAVTPREFYDYISSAYTENAMMSYEDFYKSRFGGEYPLFKEDGEGVVLVDAYRGVPAEYSYDKIRMRTSGDNTVSAYVYGTGIGGDEYIKEIRLVNQNGVWLADGMDSCDLGCMFDLYEMFYFDSWQRAYFYFPNEVKAGEEISAKVEICSNVEDVMICTDESGCEYVYTIIKEGEEFGGFDFSAQNVTGRVLGYPDPCRSAVFTLEDEGVYYAYAGVKVCRQDGSFKECTVGPMRIICR